MILVTKRTLQTVSITVEVCIYPDGRILNGLWIDEQY